MNDNEILKYDNVPVLVAAKYLGVSPQYIRIGLQIQRLPIGSAIQMSSIWSYQISPGLLVSYKTGKDYLKPLIDNIEKILIGISK